MKIGKGILGMSLLVALSFASCNKYEDGPAIVLKSKKERVANNWKIETAYNNGEDVTSEYDQYALKTTTNGDAELSARYSFGAFSYEYDTDGSWEFGNNNENLILDFEDDDADVTYQILRLLEDEMWLREQGGEDELHLITK